MNSAERLVEVIKTLSQLKSISERKKSFQLVEEILGKDDVCVVLERNGNKSHTSWKLLFELCVQFIVADLENIAASHSKVTSSKNSFNANDRATEQINFLRILLEKMESKNQLKPNVISLLVDRILFTVIDHSYKFPPDAVCNHIRIFERFVLNAGHRLVSINQGVFYNISRTAAIGCSQNDKSKIPYLQTAVRIALVRVVAGLLRFSAENLFVIRPQALSTLYLTYFKNPKTDLPIQQILAASFADLCLSLQEYPHQLRQIISEVFPKFVSLFTSSCGNSNSNETCYARALSFAFRNLGNFIALDINDETLNKLTGAISKVIEGVVSRRRFLHGTTRRAGYSSNHKTSHTQDSASNKYLIDLYVSCAHFQRTYDKSVEKLPIPCNEILATSPIWVKIATEWVNIAFEDIPENTLKLWNRWACGILTKPSRVSQHVDMLSLVLAVVKCLQQQKNLSDDSCCEIWNSVQKSFSSATAELVSELLEILIPYICSKRSAELRLQIIQFFTSDYVTFLLPIITFYLSYERSRRQSFRLELLSHLESYGSEIVSCDRVPLFSLSQLVLMTISDEIMTQWKTEGHRYDEMPFSQYNNDLYSSFDLFTFSSVKIPTLFQSDWKYTDVLKAVKSESSKWLDCIYFKLSDNSLKLLENMFPGRSTNESIVKLNVLAHFALSSSLARNGIEELAVELTSTLASSFTAEIEFGNNFLIAFRSFLAFASKAHNECDRNILLTSFTSFDFIESLYQTVIELAHNFLNNPNQAYDKTIVTEMEATEDDDFSSPLESNDLSLSKCIKPVKDLPNCQSRFLNFLDILLELSENLDSKYLSILIEKVKLVIRGVQSLSFVLNIMSLLCFHLKTSALDCFSKFLSIFQSLAERYYSDQRIMAILIMLLNATFSRNYEFILHSSVDVFVNIVSGFYGMYRLKHDNFTVYAKLQLFKLFSTISSKCEKDSFNVKSNDGVITLRSAMMSFLADQSMTIRLVSIKHLYDIVRSSSGHSDFFDEYIESLNASMRLPGDVCPSDSELTEEIENRQATYLLSLARLASIDAETSDLDDCRVSALAEIIRNRAEFPVPSVCNALSLAMAWSGTANRVTEFLEPLNSKLIVKMIDCEDPITLEHLLDVFYPNELAYSGLLEAFLLYSLPTNPSTVRECERLHDCDGWEEIKSILTKVQAMSSILQCKDNTVDVSHLFNGSHQTSEEIVRTLLAAQIDINNSELLHAVFTAFIRVAKSPAIIATILQKPGFLPFLVAAFEKRLQTEFFSVEVVQFYSALSREILTSRFPTTKESDFFVSMIFKLLLRVLTTMSTQVRLPRPGMKKILSLVIDMAVVCLNKIFEFSTISEYVAPVLTVVLTLINENVDIFVSEKLHTLCKALVICENVEVADRLKVFLNCFNVFPETKLWFGNEVVVDSEYADLCPIVRKCCRSLLRCQLVRQVPVKCLLNVWAEWAERSGDGKLAKLLLCLNRQKASSGEAGNFRMIYFTSSGSDRGNYAFHKCISKQQSANSSLDIATIFLSYLKTMFLHGVNDIHELIGCATSVLQHLPRGLMNQLPIKLISFFSLFTSQSYTLKEENLQKIEGSVWSSPMADRFPNWVFLLVCNLIRKFPPKGDALFRNPFVPVVFSQSHEIGLSLLPYLVSEIFRKCEDKSILEEILNGFAELLDSALSSENADVLQLILNIVLHLRTEAAILTKQQNSRKPEIGICGGKLCPGETDALIATSLPFSNLLKLSWLKLAKAANICSIPHAVLMFGQLHFETNIWAKFPENRNFYTITSASPDQFTAEPEFMKLLADNAVHLSYAGDLISGFVAVSDWSQHDLRFNHYKITGQWSKALGVSGDQRDCASLRFNMGDIFPGSSVGLADENNYSLMWKLADWNSLPKYLNLNEEIHPDATVFTILSSLNDCFTMPQLTSHVDRLVDSSIAAQCRAIICSDNCLENLSILSLADRLLSQPKSAREIHLKLDDEEANFMRAVVSLIKIKESPSSDCVALVNWTVSDLCKKLISSGKSMLATRLVRRYQSVAEFQLEDTEFSELAKLTDAQAAWEINEHRRAIRMVGDILQYGRKSTAILQSQAAQLFCKWNMNANIVSTGLGDSIETLRQVLASSHSSSISRDSLLQMRTALARYCEHRYRQLDNYMKSPSFVEKCSQYAKNSSDLGEIKENMHSLRGNLAQPGANRFVHSLEQFAKIDRSEIEFVKNERLEFLVEALTNYLHVMRFTASIEDLTAYRVIGLWLSNDDKAKVIEVIDKLIPSVPSAKFVSLFYQISARYCASSFTNLAQSKRCLYDLIIRIAKDHPYHALQVLVQLESSGGDGNQPVSHSRPNKRARVVPPSTAPTGNAARQILNDLAVNNDYLTRLTGSYSTLKTCYVDFANFDVSGAKSGRGEISIPERFFRQSQLPMNLPILTAPPVVQISPKPGSYESHPSFVTLKSVERTLRLLGGINLPKLIRCRASDGQIYRQLVKGANDDLRQDAVMQQVFKVVNALFLESNFQMRTYPIVALCASAGIVGFCDSTVSIGSFLVGKIEEGRKVVSAHCYYRPSNWTAYECRSLMAKFQRGSKDQRIKAFREIYQNFKPVFRFYFIENFVNPVEFLERRRKFTVSLAVSSIVGYIVGLGDRHLHNILLDLDTSELIHIDLGVAFEQGRTLSIPETVPFRLTRDLVDACGPTGVEGCFRKLCESALSVLRKNRDAIMTVLEVFSYDPLHVWTLNPLKAKQLQGNHSTRESYSSYPASFKENEDRTFRAPDNQMASRVLLQVDQKLAGEVAERGLKLEVEEQVEWLIQQSTNIENLALIYCGWQPYA